MQQEKPKKKSKIGKVRAIVPPVAARFKKPTIKQKTDEALQKVPKITTETVAEHRETVLKEARKYKYPLEHSKHKIVFVSSTILAAAVVAFMVAVLVGLYSVQTTSSFMYRVTQVVPFPVAKADKRFISYENYLFELRRYMYYYRTQQQVDFNSEFGKDQLDAYKPLAMQKILDQLYVKQLAEQNNVKVSDAEVNDALNMLKAQNRITSDKDLTSVLKRFYDWDIDDLKRQLREELLAQKVVAVLDKQAKSKVDEVVNRLNNGEDFAALAAEYSDDEATKASGGVYADTAISLDSDSVPQVVVRELSRVKAGEVARPIVTPTSYEIVKLLEVSDEGKYKAAHIEIRLKPLSDFTEPVGKRTDVTYFIKLPEDFRKQQ